MKKHLDDYFLIYILFLFIFITFPYVIYLEIQETKDCKKRGGHQVQLYRSQICVKDGLIIE